MPAQTNNLYLLEDLDDASKTSQLSKRDIAALRSVADWIESFVVKPHKDLGRDGPVCPFVPEGLERKILGSLLNISPAAAWQMWSSS